MKEIENHTNHILPFADENRDTFNLIKSGQKTIETRAGGPKYQHIKAGDRVTFTCGNDSFQKRVTNVSHFKGIDELLSNYAVTDINPTLFTKEQLMAAYSSFPGYKARLEEFGILVFDLE